MALSMNQFRSTSSKRKNAAAFLCIYMIMAMNQLAAEPSICKVCLQKTVDCLDFCLHWPEWWRRVEDTMHQLRRLIAMVFLVI